MTLAVDDTRRRQVLAQLGLVRYRLRAATVDPAAPPALHVSAPGSRAAPADGPSAEVWAAVLAWLGLDAGQVRWSGGGGVELPAVASWSGPDGKRGLWLALKGWRRPAG